MNVTVDASAFRWAVAAVAPHASTDDAMPALEAVRLCAEGDTLTLAATDRYTLGEATVRGAVVASEGFVLVPAKQLAQVVKAIPKPARYDNLPTVSVEVKEDGRVRFTHAAGTVECEPTEARFPDYQRLFPQDATETSALAFNPTMLARWAKAAGRGEAVRLTFHGADKPVTVNVGEDFRGIHLPVRIA